MDVKRCLLTNFSMDGCICKMLLTAIYNFDTNLCCGYNKQFQHFKDGELFVNTQGEKFTHLITASIALRSDMFSGLVSHYGNALSIVDHHPTTKTLVGSVGAGEAKFNFDPSVSSSESILNAIKSVGKVDVEYLTKIAQLATIYEQWNVDHSLWEDAYKLNEMFWYYSYFKFYELHKNNIAGVLFNDNEISILNGIMTEKKELISKSVKENFGQNSVLFLNAEQKVVADYTLAYKDYDVYFIIHANAQGFNTIAVRKGRKCNYGYSVGRMIRESVSGMEQVWGNGHDRVGSIAFGRETNLEEMLEVIEKVNNKLEGKDESSVPAGSPFLFGQELQSKLSQDYQDEQIKIKQYNDAGHGVMSTRYFDHEDTWGGVSNNDPVKAVLSKMVDAVMVNVSKKEFGDIQYEFEEKEEV